MNNWQNHTPLGQGIDYLPRLMSLNAIQCSEDEWKVQYLLGFGNRSTFVYYPPFHGPMTILVAEGSLSLSYPAFWSIQNRNSVVGEIWTNKTVNESGYFNRSMFRSDDNTMLGVSGLRYRYTVINRVKNLCPIKKPVKRKEERYPKGNSYDMRSECEAKSSYGGVYDDETGKLCMVGCRKLGPGIQKSTGDPMNCEILLRFQFPPTNAKKGGSQKIHMEDGFGDHHGYDLQQARVCLCGITTLLRERNPQVLPFVSLVMLVILTLGHTIPLVLNFEALFLGNCNRENILLGKEGWLEVNKLSFTCSSSLVVDVELQRLREVEVYEKVNVERSE
ncbi:hypothetical protein Acr_19g0004570 [Actinidia rufa]|uniref:RING-type E3 ubiquitin transferase n=1 Tax=Actinidia rufa TaxID=165716 RepID=A0A7J0G9R4_9ERIC|nr:hypothetical protein Acr_19g0004570 [Actinidia rufa]